MHYKIASLVLNAGKHQNGSREIYIAQPDAVKEGLAGRLFLLAEIDGRRTDTKKIVDFIATNLEDFYYNDEKIFLQDKIEGLTLDNIFEAALAKLNKELLEFLTAEKIALRPEDSNLILGLIFENKLLFSNFGRNKSFLIYKRQDQYELINVEASAAEAENQEFTPGAATPKFFASVISGEIPPASYFIFCNEVLPEYLSNKDLINVVTKLPPMVAAEQIKGMLAKLNSYVPFLAVIIKNTFGLSPSELKDEFGEEVNRSAHNSISHLNYTEKKTEQMLAPAGLINWKKLSKAWLKVSDKFNGAPLKLRAPMSDLKTSAPLNRHRNLLTAKMIKEKITFSRGYLARLLKILSIAGVTIINLFNPIFWRNSWQRGRLWLSSLNRKNKLMISVFALAFLILLGSLIITGVRNKRQADIAYFNDLISSLETKRGMTESYLLYNNQEGAKILIGESLAALDALPVKGEEQAKRRDELRASIEKQREAVQKISTIDSPELIGDFKSHNGSAESRNLIIAGDKIYAADPAAKAVYTLDVSTRKIGSILLTGDFNVLDKPFNLETAIYYLSGNRLAELDLRSGKNKLLNIDGVGVDDKITSFQLYNSKLYALIADKNQIYKFNRNGDAFGSKSAWLKEEVALGDAVDLSVTGDLLVLKSNGQLQKFYVGRRQDFNLTAVDPTLDSASLFKIAGDRLFILDKNSKRLVVFDKQGILIWQYRFPSLNNLKDFTISADAKNVYLLNDDSVYKLTF